MKFFALVILEIFFFTFFAEKYGFLNTMLAYWVPTILGFSLLPRLGLGFQTIKINPEKEAAGLHRVLLFVGCLLLITPLLSFRVVGIFLILPGFRHLLIWKLAQLIKKQMISTLALSKVSITDIFQMMNPKPCSAFWKITKLCTRAIVLSCLRKGKAH